MLAPLLLALAVQLPPALAEDSVHKIRRAARRAEAEFERLARRLVPIQISASDGGRCDEIVGRFCLIYDSGRLPEPQPESARVIDARRAAIEALRLAFSYLPGDFGTAGPLIRYLVEDDRAAEAVPAARLFLLESRDSIWGSLLLGFALHAANDDTAAARLFDDALARLDARDRRRIQDVEWLVGASDRRRYDQLTEEELRRFEDRLWALSDPLYLTAGNERKNEHIARHIWSRILARTPIVQDMARWGADLEQLTVRYGIPTSRTRSPGYGLGDGTLVEHYDPDQLAYVPEDLLTRGLQPTPLPERPWELENERSRSGYAPGTIRLLRPMPHQVSRFPAAGGSVLRVDGSFGRDSLAADADSLLAALFIMDHNLVTVLDRRAWITVSPSDTAAFAFEVEIPPGEYVYSIEALEPVTRLASRARYAATIEDRSGTLALSDPVVNRPWRGRPPPGSAAERNDVGFRPMSRLTFAPFDTIGIYAEIHGLSGAPARYEVRLSIEPASRASLPARIVSWLGGRLGLSDAPAPARLRWTDQAQPARFVSLGVDLFLAGARRGNQVVVLHVRDLANGAEAESRRIVRIR